VVRRNNEMYARGELVARSCGCFAAGSLLTSGGSSGAGSLATSAGGARSSGGVAEDSAVAGRSCRSIRAELGETFALATEGAGRCPGIPDGVAVCGSFWTVIWSNPHAGWAG